MYDTKTMTVPELITLLESADMEDDAVFSKVVQDGLGLLNIGDEELCRRFDMSRTSARRWREGRSYPHPAMRKHVFSWFLKKARAAIEAES